MMLVCVQVGVLQAGVEHPMLEASYTLFFTLEVSGRIWAHTAWYFFMGYTKSCLEASRWINTV
jgi:hypothetical protein